MQWKVDFYNQKVYNALMLWPDNIKAKFIRLVDLIKKQGADLGMPYTRSLGDGLYELRIKGKEGIGRAFFCYVVNRRVIILHGFIKKTQRIPQQELKLAQRRLNEVKHHVI